MTRKTGLLRRVPRLYRESALIDYRKIILTVVAAWGAISTTYAQPRFGPCGEKPTCDSKLGVWAQRLHDAWNSGATTDDQRRKMAEIIAAHTKNASTEWPSAASEYFLWRNGAPYSLQPAPTPSTPSPSKAKANYGQMRQIAENYIRGRLVDPKSALFEWPNGFKDNNQAYVTCGYVNARNRMGGFTGRTAFIISLKDMAVIYYDMDEGGKMGVVELGCKSANFPPPPSEMVDQPAASNSSLPTPQERLKRLEELHKNGFITKSEYEEQRKAIISSL